MTDEQRGLIECLSNQLDRKLEYMRQGGDADATRTSSDAKSLVHEITDWREACQWVEELSIEIQIS